MRFVLMGLAVLGLSVALLTSANAGGAKDGKAVELKGNICCAKCELGIAKKCETVIVTKENGKDVTIYFDAASHKKHHGAICSTAKEGVVTGVVSTEGDRKVVAVTAVKFN